jgi:predicted RNA methylase
VDLSVPAQAVAATTTILPIALSATWSATSGLNALDPTNPSFISFDPSAYAAMRDDPTRTPLFKRALQQRLQASPPLSQVVLDLGTGPFALFAILAAELGAAKVYAIEANPSVAAYARQVIQKQGWDDIITVLEGFSTDITLPDNIKADIIVAEVVGSIASEEGAYATILDAHQRLLKQPNDPNNWIPNRIQTWAAPASYTLHNLFQPPEFDWTKIAAEPVRFNCRDTNLALLDDPQCVEDIVFVDIVKNRGSTNSRTTTATNLHFTASGERMQEACEIFAEEYRKGGLSKSEAIALASTAAHSCTGIALWPRLYLPAGSSNSNGGEGDATNASTMVINSRSHPLGGPQKSHWQTVLPIMSARPVTGIQAGDSIEVMCHFDAAWSTRVTVAPTYSITSQVFATGGGASSA